MVFSWLYQDRVTLILCLVVHYLQQLIPFCALCHIPCAVHQQSSHICCVLGRAEQYVHFWLMVEGSFSSLSCSLHISWFLYSVEFSRLLLQWHNYLYEGHSKFYYSLQWLGIWRLVWYTRVTSRQAYTLNNMVGENEIRGFWNREVQFVVLYHKNAGNLGQSDMASSGKNEQWVAMTGINFSLQGG